MKFTRREIVLMGLGLLAASGCSTTAKSASQNPSPGVPSPDWPEVPESPTPLRSRSNSVMATPWKPGPNPKPFNNPGAGAHPQAESPVPETAAGLPPTLSIIPRYKWAEEDPISNRLNPMNGVSMITVHHEGWTPVWFSDYDTMRTRMDQIRKSHLQRLGAADIGYHMVIDRSGRLWQGREIKYQGAHVHANNEHNLGVMVLGNFDLQTPTSAQTTALQSTLVTLMKFYKIPVSRVKTHREINPTECPGNNLQPLIEGYRKGVLLNVV